VQRARKDVAFDQSVETGCVDRLYSAQEGLKERKRSCCLHRGKKEMKMGAYLVRSLVRLVHHHLILQLIAENKLVCQLHAMRLHRMRRPIIVLPHLRVVQVGHSVLCHRARHFRVTAAQTTGGQGPLCHRHTTTFSQRFLLHHLVIGHPFPPFIVRGKTHTQNAEICKNPSSLK